MGSKPRRGGTCGTPGTVYETELADSEITLRMLLPAPILTTLNKADRKKLIDDLHGSIIPTMEWLFSCAWDEHFAGRLIHAASDDPLPAKHEDLFLGPPSSNDIFEGRGSVWSSSTPDPRHRRY